MTNFELIHALQTLPGNAEAVIGNADDGAVFLIEDVIAIGDYVVIRTHDIPS